MRSPRSADPKTHSAAKGPSQRQLQAGELIRHRIVDILAEGELRDPALVGVSITVGEVRCSPDLKQATVFVAPLGVTDPKASRLIADALNRASGFVRSRLAKALDMRHTPNLSFVADSSYEEAMRIEALLRQPTIARDLNKATKATDSES
jgi:ribosome-binding factor A